MLLSECDAFHFHICSGDLLRKISAIQAWCRMISLDCDPECRKVLLTQVYMKGASTVSSIRFDKSVFLHLVALSVVFE